MERIEREKKKVFAESGSRDLVTVVVAFAVTVTSIGLILLPFKHNPLWQCDSYQGAYPVKGGFSFSLVLYFAPALVGLVWATFDPKFKSIRKPLWTSLVVLWVFAVIADLGILGGTFFTFPAPESAKLFKVPAWDWWEMDTAWIPVEDLLFYIGAVTLTLVTYVWASQTFLKTTSEDYLPNWRGQDIAEVVRNGTVVDCWHGAEVSAEKWEGSFKQVLKTIFGTLKKRWAFPLGAGIALVAATVTAFLLQHFLNPEGFLPLYLIWLTVGVTVPSMLLLAFTVHHTNWRAFGFTALYMLMLSGLFEISIALPYEWWGFRQELLTGWQVAAWWDLPIEQTVLYVVNTWEIVLIYEAITVFQAWKSGRTPPPGADLPWPPSALHGPPETDVRQVPPTRA